MGELSGLMSSIIKVLSGFAGVLVVTFTTRVLGAGGLLASLVVVTLGLWAAKARRRSEPAVIGPARYEPPPLDKLRPQRAWRVPFRNDDDL